MIEGDCVALYAGCRATVRRVTIGLLVRSGRSGKAHACGPAAPRPCGHPAYVVRLQGTFCFVRLGKEKWRSRGSGIVTRFYPRPDRLVRRYGITSFDRGVYRVWSGG